MRMMKRVAVPTTVLLLLFVATAQALPVTLFDINFESPIQTAGSRVVTGVGIEIPSSVVFGNPDIAVINGSQWLCFNTAGNLPQFYYDQIRMAMGKGYDYYDISFDFYTNDFFGSNNKFTLLSDTPIVNNLNFRSNGTIDWWNTAGQRSIGLFNENVTNHIDMSIDLVNSAMEIALNGQSVSVPFLASGGDIFALRGSFGAVSSGRINSTRDSFYIDNFLVLGDNKPIEAVPVPEPATILLLGTGLLAGSFSLRKIKK